MSMYAMFLVAFSLFATVGVVTAFVLGRRLRIRCVREPACRQCGYAVKGLNSMTCPECGADFRKVGILVPDMRKPLGRWWCILLWTIFMPVPTYTISYLLIEEVAPHVRIVSQSATVTKPLSGQFHRIDFNVDARGMQWPWEDTMRLRPSEPDPGLPEATTTVRIWTRDDDDAPQGTIAVIDETGAWQLRNAVGEVLLSGDGPFGSMELLRSFEAVGMDISNRELNSEGAYMSSVFRSSLGQMPNVLKGNLATATVTVGQTTNYNGPLPWLRWPLLGLWTIIWIIGIVYLFIWTRRERTAT